jgi:glutathione S-transferase
MMSTSMIVLHYAPGTASLVVHWLLIELGVPHELRRVDLDAGEQRSAAYLALNPSGVVPTLVVDGQPICEAAAIVMHLADVHPGLAPPPATPARAQYYQWMLFLANTLQPAYRAWFYPTEPAGEANQDASKQHARARIEAAWQRVEAHLAANGPYVLGAAPSAADFLMTMLMRWSRNMPRPADSTPACAAYARRMKDRPSFREVYAREGLTDWT